MKFLICFFSLALSALPLWGQEPDIEDICSMLERDIEGKMYSFLAGNKMYYIGGKVNETWDHVYHESLGFSHPMYRDGRARGYGIANGPGGRGHDKFGWEFWNHTKAAKGSVVIDGKTHTYPRPTEMLWRPDGVSCRYELGGVVIEEEKFISKNDVLTTIIKANADISLVFDGHSFVLPGEFPTEWGDAKGQKWHYERNSNIDHKENYVHIQERGGILTKPTWESKALRGRMMYDGMHTIIMSSHAMKSVKLGEDAEKRQTFRFKVELKKGEAYHMTYAMHDDASVALKHSREVIAHAQRAMEDKTKEVNTWLSRQIPRFRCSDEMAVKTYYYLWSLYYMYTTNIGEGFESYPHTQTAINNFMGLHLWDSWAYAAMGGWVKDKWDYGFGNVLSWKHMVPFKNKDNALPDNFGIHWYSPEVFMPFVGSVDFAWDMYLKSGDKTYLKVAYEELYRPLYWDNKGPQESFGSEINAIDALVEMAKELGHHQDIAHWLSFRDGRVEGFLTHWGTYAQDYYARGNEPWKDIWQLSSLLCNEMPDQWAQAMTDRWIMNTEEGYLGPVAIRIRPPLDPPNGVFRVSTISTWLAIEGMFRHHCDEAGVFTTLSHIRGMHRDHGFPVAPECWDPNDKPWGSLYYNWDGPITDLILRRLAGISFSQKDNSFTLADHMPESWSFMDIDLPVTQHGKTKWVQLRYRQTSTPEGAKKQIEVKGQPFRKLTIEPWQMGRKFLSGTDGLSAGQGKGHQGVVFRNKKDAKVEISLGERYRNKKTYAVVKPTTKRAFSEAFEVEVENLIPGTELRYSFDGEPDLNSPKVDGPILISKTTDLNLRAFDSQGTVYSTMPSVKFDKVKLLTGSNNPSKSGLQYEIFDGKWKSIPDLSGLQPVAKGICKDLKVQGLPTKADHFAVRFKGYIRVDKSAVYNFKLKSDDGCRVKINGKTVVDLNILCDRDPWTGTGAIGLEAGKHTIEVIYFQDLHRKSLELSFDIENHNYKAVQPQQFSH